MKVPCRLDAVTSCIALSAKLVRQNAPIEADGESSLSCNGLFFRVTSIDLLFSYYRNFLNPKCVNSDGSFR